MSTIEEELRALRLEVEALRREKPYPLPPVLSKSRAAWALDRSKKTLQRMIRLEEILTVRVHGQEMIPLSEIEKFAKPDRQPKRGGKKKAPPRPVAPKSEGDKIRARLREMGKAAKKKR